MHIIAVLNQKGGVGKTTTTVNLAAYLAKAGKRVLVIDFDPQGNATSGLGIDKTTVEATAYDVISGKAELDRAIYESANIHLSIMPSNANLAAAEIELADKHGRELYLRNLIQSLDYDVIFIDCPPSLGLLTINALAAAQWLLIPVQAEYYALEGLGQLLDVFARVRQSLNTQLELLGVLVTMFDSRNSLADQVYKELSKHFGPKLFKTIIPRNVRLAEAPSYGRPISEHDKWSKGARAYKQLSKEVISRVG